MSAKSLRAITPRLGQVKDAGVSAEATMRHIRRGEKVPIDERVLMIAEAEYERQYGTGQTIDRLRQRGGLGLTEALNLLAEAVVRYAPDDALIPRSLTREEDPSEEGSSA